MESIFPVATTFEVKYGEPPRYIQIIREEKLFSLLRPRKFWVLMALMKAHNTGQLRDAGHYSIIVYSRHHYRVYRGEEFMPDLWEEVL